jgi:simple sugar transport system substrate-binding protein
MSGSRKPSRLAARFGRAGAILAAAAVLAGACNLASSPSPSGSGAAAAPTTGQFCQGVKIVFFPGGTSGGGFETVVYNGAKAAEAAFGPTVTYQWSDWDPNKMVSQFREAVATKPDGIAIMGHPGDDAFDPLIDDARSQGILVTAMNTELQTAEAKYATAGFGYVGAVLHDAGAALANEAIARGGLKSGDRAFVWGLQSQPGRGERTKGILDALKAAGLQVDYQEIDDATNKDPAAGVATFTGYASSHSDLKAIFIDHGNLTSTIPTYMKAANLAAGSIYAAGFDLSPSTVQGVKDGYVNLVIDQQQYLQGFLAIQQLCLTKKYGFSGLFVNTGGGFVDKNNIDVIAPLVTQQIR